MTPDDVIPLRMATYMNTPPHPLAGRPGLVNGYVVRHARGAFLFDTGMGDAPIPIPGFAPSRRDLRDALEEVGVEPARVVAIANSHLHFDHCGGNRLFPGVPIYAQRRERENADLPHYTLPEYVAFPGARYVLVEEDAEPLEGIRIIATPGHTVGHQSVAVETSAGVVVLAGHAIYSREEWLGAPAMERSEEARRSADRLRGLGPRRVHFGHDDGVWERGAEVTNHSTNV
jgi:N-acyl homoserine lactone hydrolase